MKKNNRLLWIALVALIGIAIYFLGSTEKKTTIIKHKDSKTTEPQFVKEGQLWFIGKENKDTIRLIDIEVADNAQDRAQGMMHRTAMPDDRGMLFIFKEEREQSFWMKNTPLSLDIIYVNKGKEIVTIYKHTQPYSENPIPSFKEALYVVETVAGFCDKYDVKEGDFIEYNLQKNTENPL
ncbi:DUF192 domain-containing protein [Fulvivirgaceae bacterium BMA12]|uniref:DUF192 domain-containing protein n=1 Tax=Agaribacillus aureus TaxID=3051825 RepID=A0ABT8L124_9BACT|nr:DUF192 domain-containing protein [Fulvivirgaceae bacterium BMA12]